MSSNSERPTMCSENIMMNTNENLKIGLENNNNILNIPKEINNSKSFDKLASLQKLILKQANLKEMCNTNIKLYYI